MDTALSAWERITFPMQHLFEKNGFERCGVIYVENGTPRFAYQRCAR